MTRPIQKTLDQRLTAALEQAPATPVPGDFAQRLMQRLPARPARVSASAVTSPGIARRVAYAAVLTLIAAMLAIALATHGGLTATAVEWSLAAELILLGVWLGLRPQWLQ